MKIRSALAPAMMACPACAIRFDTRDAAFAQAGKDFRVAYLPCGRVNDQSWSQAGYEGIVRKKEVESRRLTLKRAPADMRAARDYASRGYNLVLLHCATFMDAASKSRRTSRRLGSL